MNLYRDESSNPKWNAQRNLCGRTHYVDDATLRFHKSRILKTVISDGGLLFGLVESCALDMHNTRRGYRPVIFDVFGTILDRPKLDECYRTSRQATAALYANLEEIAAKQHTLAAITEHEKRARSEYADFRDKVRKL